MANVTDPLARALHGTDPQNLIEYITRQKIYDCRYWKEECFGLSAVDILEKAMNLKHIGGSYGGNMQPSYFLCLTLKMLQIQPEDEIVYALVENEDFKYVRALGSFYLRLTGRPKDVWSYLESVYSDNRKLRHRTPSNTWELTRMDEFIDILLTEAVACGVSLPRLPQRNQLVDAGYLDGPRISAIFDGDVIDKFLAENMLQSLAENGNKRAQDALAERQVRIKAIKQESDSRSSSKKNKLFKDSSRVVGQGGNIKKKTETKVSSKLNQPEEGSVEYWNEQRANLGLKPLKPKDRSKSCA